MLGNAHLRRERTEQYQNIDETGKQVWELTGVGRVGNLRACSLMPQFALRRDGSIVVVTRSNMAGSPGS